MKQMQCKINFEQMFIHVNMCTRNECHLLIILLKAYIHVYSTSLDKGLSSRKPI